MNKVFLKAISIFSAVALVFSFSASPHLDPRQHGMDSLAVELEQTQRLISERAELVDSLQYYKEQIKFRYQVLKGRRYTVVHQLPGQEWIFYYRIAQVDDDHPGPDTVFIGKQIVKF